MHMEASAFVKKKRKLLHNYFCTGITGWILADRKKIAFLQRHKFPPGCDGHISKFPIQSLYYPWFQCSNFTNPKCCSFLLCEVQIVSGSKSFSCSLFFPFPSPPSLVELVSIELVSISTDLVSVTVPGGWLPLAELLWMPVCPAQGLWLKAHCLPWNHHPLWQAPSPSSSTGDEFNNVFR